MRLGTYHHVLALWFVKAWEMTAEPDGQEACRVLVSCFFVSLFLGVMQYCL